MWKMDAEKLEPTRSRQFFTETVRPKGFGLSMLRSFMNDGALVVARSDSADEALYGCFLTIAWRGPLVINQWAFHSVLRYDCLPAVDSPSHLRFLPVRLHRLV